ncbi:MAG: DEAD/DEAH box helicase [Frankiaceae bacterium]|nr:DEAD/DEAH box helicase [Frankiaceae bacterium]
MLRGLFIGINAYKAPVTRLSCAVPDAIALASLFADTHQGQIRELVDDAATKLDILRSLAGLESADPDDVVIITYSGHGTEDHELVPFDVDPTDLAGSCISLDSIAEALDRIPSKHLIVVLDCCFSGGFGGSRVFAPAQSRSAIEDRSSLDGLAQGSGRIVITASGAGEPAFETAEFGHGLLSYFMIKGLQGTGDLGADDRIPLNDLFSYVMQSVLDAAERMRGVQTPTTYGSIEGAPSLQKLVAGSRYAAAFPDRVRPPATDAWSSLEPYGVRQEFLNLWSAEMPGLNALQTEAINHHGVLDGESVLVVAPTGAGKTMIGELAAVQAVSNHTRAVVLLPLRALVNDKYEYMRRVYGDSVVTVRATGEFGDEVGAILNGQFDVALLTYEKFLNLILGYPHIMRSLSVVVVDEVQTVAMPDRGPSLEFLLTLLRSGHGRTTSPQVVALSAVIGNTRGMERWLGGSLLETLERPVPLREAVVDAAGGLRIRESDGTERTEPGYIQPELVSGSQSNKPYIIPLVRRLVSEGKKVIVFRATRGDTVGAARYLAQDLRLPAAAAALALLPDGDRADASEALRQDLQHGVAFHNSDLDGTERLAVETAFRDPSSGLQVVVATTTLAMGVNTPAEAVVIAGLRHPFGDPYSVAEYKNMAGRAGRPGHVEAGEAYIVAASDPGPIAAWSTYVLGEPEAIESHFMSDTTDEQTLTLRCLVALGGSVAEDDLRELLDNSFAVWLRKEAGQLGWDTGELARDINALVEGELLDREPDGSLTLTELGRFAGESGIEVRSITQVSSLLRFAPDSLSLGDIVVLAQVTVELDQLWIPANKKSRREQQRWPMTLQQLGVSDRLLSGLHVGGGDPLQRTKRATACLYFMSAMRMSEIEADLLQHYRDRSAAGSVRSTAARTRDVLEAVARVAVFRGKTVTDEDALDHASLRLELGLPAEVVPLADELGAILSRADYLRLASRGIVTPEASISTGEEVLIELLGEDRAKQVRDRLDQLGANEA